MKKSIIKTILTTATISMFVLPCSGVSEVSAAQAKPTATPATKATAAPIMRDNLAKYGLVKEVELPVTIEKEGFSYTLEKIMIYESSSPTAQSLIKKYGYYGDKKYFIWTKITIQNNSKSVVQFSSKDLSDKWRLNFGERSVTDMPQKFYATVNSKEALWTWKLNSGEKLSTYQAYLYNDTFKEFYVSVHMKNSQTFKQIANIKEN
ncbi:hypothetical protein [Paenibacillus sp. FSL R7-0331]|uniref:hypothetical protein n=1 Tax=Paenibacillus sp. FSL R7-0331 TaxID=1536773 RepID=UPI0004F7ADAD|nr:hypothetical protein [Paenibacillus sp. FSL R7-0331]AIQ51098.1 hypothetical protein R70331_05940 [Paenibacillus sp. FSL R7-0331]